MAKERGSKRETGEPTSGPCIGGCGKTLGGNEFCYGCKSFICMACDKIDLGHMGAHEPEAHLIVAGEDDA